MSSILRCGLANLPVTAYYIAQVKETITKLMAAVRALPPLSMVAINATARLALPQIGCCNPGCDRQAARPQYQASQPASAISHHSLTAPCLHEFIKVTSVPAFRVDSVEGRNMCCIRYSISCATVAVHWFLSHTVENAIYYKATQVHVGN